MRIKPWDLVIALSLMEAGVDQPATGWEKTRWGPVRSSQVQETGKPPDSASVYINPTQPLSIPHASLPLPVQHQYHSLWHLMRYHLQIGWKWCCQVLGGSPEVYEKNQAVNPLPININAIISPKHIYMFTFACSRTLACTDRSPLASYW